MTHSFDINAELTTKCRRLCYDLVTGSTKWGVSSGGGAWEHLSGEDIVRAKFYLGEDDLGNEIDPATVIGCLEEYFTPHSGQDPESIDLTKTQACHDAIATHQAAVKDEADFVFECGLEMTGAVAPTAAALVEQLKIKEVLTRTAEAESPDFSEEENNRIAFAIAVHDHVVELQGELAAKTTECRSCCVVVLETRDAAIKFAPLMPHKETRKTDEAGNFIPWSPE